MIPHRLTAELQTLQKDAYSLVPRDDRPPADSCSRDLAFGPPGAER